MAVLALTLWLILAGQPALALDPDKIQDQVNEAAALLEKGKQTKGAERQTHYGKAAALLAEILDSYPDLDGVRILRGKILLKTGQLNEAAADAQKVLERASDNRQAQWLLDAVQKEVMKKAPRRGESHPPSGRARPSSSPFQVLDASVMEGIEAYLVEGRHTLFYFTNRTHMDHGSSGYQVASQKPAGYVLRVVELGNEAQGADVGVSWAEALGVDRVPYLMFYGPDGALLSRGSRKTVDPALEQFERERIENLEKRKKKDGVIDVSWKEIEPSQVSAKGMRTLVLVTSAACKTCLDANWLLYEARDRMTATRALVADVGVTEYDEINWDAPIFSTVGDYALPYFLLYNSNGTLISHGRKDILQTLK